MPQQIGSPTPALPRREGDTWGDRNLQRRVFKISLRLGWQGRLPRQRNKSYCYSCEAPYTSRGLYTQLCCFTRAKHLTHYLKNKDNEMKLSFNKNNLPWMLIVLASFATGYGYILLSHVLFNV